MLACRSRDSALPLRFYVLSVRPFALAREGCCGVTARRHPPAFFRASGPWRTVRCGDTHDPSPVHRTEVFEMYPQSRKFGWYLVLFVLLLFVVKDPDGAVRLARLGGGLLSDAAGALARLAGAI